MRLPETCVHARVGLDPKSPGTVWCMDCDLVLAVSLFEGSTGSRGAPSDPVPPSPADEVAHTRDAIDRAIGRVRQAMNDAHDAQRAQMAAEARARQELEQVHVLRNRLERLVALL